MTMREILFRGKHITGSPWCYGNLAVGRNGVSIITPDATPCGVYGQVDPDTVGQFTGFTDKAGKKIYEGDICRFKEWRKGKACWIGKVFFEYGIYVIAGGPNEECELPFNMQMSRLDISEMEVIGNIHDNPELMEDN